MAVFTEHKLEKTMFDSIPEVKRGKTLSIKDTYGAKYASTVIGDASIHDANFAFLSTTLAKLHKSLYEPKYHTTWQKDIPVDTGGGFVDYIEYYTVDWAGIMNEFRNAVGNNVNYVPRVNAGLSQNRVNVYTFEVAYDLRFIELEKMKKVQLQKSIQDIYNNIIVANWDLYIQKIAYVGMSNTKGLFNHTNVKVTTIDNSATTGKGFQGMSDAAVVSFFNGVFESYLANSNMNITILPDTFLVPDFVGADLVTRFSTLYTSTLRDFIVEHNLAKSESDGAAKVKIFSRPALNDLGTSNHGRIVAYKMDKDFVRLDIPYPMQHYITLPNIEKMSYTSVFVGQVSEIQLPYNTSSADLGIVSYWDFTSAA